MTETLYNSKSKVFAVGPLKKMFAGLEEHQLSVGA